MLKINDYISGKLDPIPLSFTTLCQQTVEKVVNTKTEEIPHQKVSLSPRAPPKGFAQDNRCVALIVSPLAVTMLLHGERASGTSARRRRERRLRSWAKHERMSIAVALAENFHHSRQKVEGNASDGLRAQKSARAAGYHPGVLKDPEVQWFKERSLFVSAGCPSLVVSPLTGHDGLDSRTLQFLQAQSLAPGAQELSNVESNVESISNMSPNVSVSFILGGWTSNRRQTDGHQTRFCCEDH